MKALLFLVIFLEFSTFAQCDTSEAIDFPDVEAQFPGGTLEMKRFLVDNIEYPDIGRCSLGQFTGTIYVQFIVCPDGSINGVHCIRPSETEFDQMAIDIIEKMPKWIPGEINGKPVTSRCRLPLIICLQ